MAAAEPTASADLDHRFTLSDYYSPQALDALHAASQTPTPPPQAQPTNPQPQPQRQQSARAAAAALGPQPSPPIGDSNRRETDPFASSAEQSRGRPALPPSSSPDPLGAMALPLGPGPQPYPASPDGHASDTEDYIPDVTYPPRGYRQEHPPRSAPARRPQLQALPASAGPSPSTSRDIQRERLGMGDRAQAAVAAAAATGSSASAAQRAYAQRLAQAQREFQRAESDRPTSPHSPSAFSYANASTGRQRAFSPSTDAASTLSGGLSTSSHLRTMSPFDDEKLRGLDPERPLDADDHDGDAASDKDLPSVPALATLPAATSRALPAHGPGAHAHSRRSQFLENWLPKTWPCRLLLIVVFLEAIIDIAIQSNILWRMTGASYIVNDRDNRRLPVYLYIFVTAHVVQCGLTVWAIRTRNTIQVIVLAIFNALFLLYSAFEISEVRQLLGNNSSGPNGQEVAAILSLPINVLTGLSVGIIAASCVAVAVLTYFIWREFGWDIYRSLGADLRIRKYYFQYQVFECLVCFSFFFFAGFGVQFALLVLDKGDAEYIVTWVMFPLLLLWLVMGLVSARFEWAFPMAAFLVVLLGGTAYFIFKLVRIWTQPDVYRYVEKSLTVFSVLSLCTIILTLAYGVLVWRNFRRGLRQSLDARRAERKAERLALRNTTSNVPLYKAHRLTID